MMPSAPPPALLWIDPGGMTGFAWLISGQFHAEELPFYDACIYLESLCQVYWKTLHIGWERFTIGPSTHKLSPQPEAYEFPGVIRYLAGKHGCVLLEPSAPADRLAASPAELKAIGWWPAGLDDAQSAAQHLLAWLRRENCVPPDTARKLAQAR